MYRLSGINFIHYAYENIGYAERRIRKRAGNILRENVKETKNKVINVFAHMLRAINNN